MKIAKVKVPQFPQGDYPNVTQNEVEERYRRLIHAMTSTGVDFLLIYGDREHFANICYLTGGYDSRFEESLLIVPKEGTPTLIVGNEGFSYADIALLDVKKTLFQTFSLQGQVRNAKRYLAAILKDECGISDQSKVGIVGLKEYENGETRDPEHTFDIPHYIVEELLRLVSPDAIRNATGIMTNPLNGLRSTMSSSEIARAEFMANYLSQQMHRAIARLAVGMSEVECASSFEYRGIPFTYHPIVNFGADRVLLGLGSPRFDVRLSEGDAVSIAFGAEGANIARTGLAVKDDRGYVGAKSKIVEDFYFPYFEAMSQWYESLAVGVGSPTVYESVMSRLSDQRFGVTLNPGHGVHMEEWVNSAFRDDADCTLKSGMAFQCDIIAFPGDPYVGVHVEDPVVIADSDLRQEIEAEYPDTWNRIQRRRDFMRHEVGVMVGEDTLPLSNIQGLLHPFLLSSSSAVIR